MKIENNIYLKLFLYFFSIIIIFLLGLYMFDILNLLDRHWTSIYDHELTIAYNSLLFNSGLKHEYVDHSGYFTILFLSIFYNLLNLFDLLSVYKFSIFKQSENFNEDLNVLLFYARIFAALSVFIFITLTFYIINYFTKSILFSLILTLIVLTSFGTIIHATQLRTELLAMFFFLLAFFNLRLFFDRNKFFYFLFFLVFFYCAVLNKTQVFLYLPVILFLGIFDSKKFTGINTSNFKFLEHKNVKYIIILILFIYLILKYLSTYNKDILSPVFIIYNFCLFNLIFFYILKKNNLRIESNLVLYNISIILVFLLFKNFLFIHPSTNEEAFINTFTNIMSNTKYINISNVSFLEDLLRYKFHLFLLLFSLSTSIIFRKKIGKKNLYFSFICILSFLYIFGINMLRPNLIYLIFSDFFLILSLSSLAKLANFKKYSIALILLLVTFYIQHPILENYKSTIRIDKIVEICNSNYFFDWQKKIDKEKFIKFCKSNNINNSYN